MIIFQIFKNLHNLDKNDTWKFQCFTYVCMFIYLLKNSSKCLKCYCYLRYAADKSLVKSF